MVKVNYKTGTPKTIYLKRKYKLKDNVKTAIFFLIAGAFITTVLFIQADRVERIENTGDTETKAIQVQLTR